MKDGGRYYQRCLALSLLWPRSVTYPSALEIVSPARLRALTRSDGGFAGRLRVAPMTPSMAANDALASRTGTARALNPIMPSSGTIAQPCFRTRPSSCFSADFRDRIGGHPFERTGEDLLRET